MVKSTKKAVQAAMIKNRGRNIRRKVKGIEWNPEEDAPMEMDIDAG